MSEFNLELFKTLILNYVYIHSKRREKGMFTLYHQDIYPDKVTFATNSPIYKRSFAKTSN